MRRGAALRAPGLDRADRVVGEVAPVPRRSWPRRATAPAALARITTPIGLPEITGKDPATIAVGVAADLLMRVRTGARRRRRQDRAEQVVS